MHADLLHALTGSIALSVRLATSTMAQYRPMMAGHPLTQQWKEEEGYTTHLHIAALEGNTVALLRLLRAGQFVDAPDHNLKTPLHLAAACKAMHISKVSLRSLS